MSYDREDNGRYKELRFNCPNDSISCDNIYMTSHIKKEEIRKNYLTYTRHNIITMSTRVASIIHFFYYYYITGGLDENIENCT